MTTTYLRHANLPDIAGTLQDFRDRAVDLVAGAGRIKADERGLLNIEDSGPAVLSEEGVTTTPGTFTVSEVANEGISEKLGIPQAYGRKLLDSHPALWASNVNGWLERDERKFLVRTYGNGSDGAAHEDGQPSGLVRAFLSDSYRTIDNFDIVTAVLSGVADIMDPRSVKIEGDLTERRLYLRLTAPSISVAAEALLRRYRAPNGDMGRDNPTIWAGIAVRNSEVGNGAFSIVPQAVVQVCTNGLTVTKDAMREVHLGSKMDEGVIHWSADTERKNLALITAQTRDAVKAFLNPEYLQHVVNDLTATAEAPVRDAKTTMAKLAKAGMFSKSQADSILGAFIDGADATAGGVMQAMTAVANTTSDADAAYDLESKAIAGMELAAR